MAHDRSRQSGSDPRSGPSVAQIQTWLVEQLANELQTCTDRIKLDQPILSHGIDSMQVVVIIARLEDWLGFRFSSNPLEDHPTIESLSEYAADLNEESQSTAS